MLDTALSRTSIKSWRIQPDKLCHVVLIKLPHLLWMPAVYIAKLQQPSESRSFDSQEITQVLCEQALLFVAIIRSMLETCV